MIEVVTAALSGSNLAQAALRGDAAVRGWYVPRPVDLTGWHTALAAAAATAPRDWFVRLEPALVPHGAAAERLARVTEAGGAVITTGQQPGLFGGPLYTLHKALSALALAGALERETGIPVAPVFWAATDDSDLAEASVVWINGRGGLRELAMPSPGTRRRAMADTPLGDIGELLDALASACGSAADPSVIEAARTSYAPGTTVGAAYVRFLRTLLEPLGIAVLDAAHPAVRIVAAPVMRAALSRADDVAAALAERERGIESAGFRPQVPSVRGLSLVFETAPGGERERIPLRAAARAAAEVADVALGPNVLLRPIVERSILPTAAYVAGPGEIAYFAQVTAVADALGSAAPRAVPRWSGVIIERQVGEALDECGATIDDLRDPHALEGRIARAEIAAPLREALDSLRAGIERGLGEIERYAPAPPLARSAATARAGVAQRLMRLERRLAAEVKARGTRRLAAVATARRAIFPNGHPQERVLAFAPFLARYGNTLVEAVLRAAGRHAQELIGE